MKKDVKAHRPSDLATLSTAISFAAKQARNRQKHQLKVWAKTIKNCPCNGRVCEEGSAGGLPCQPGVCVRMN